MKALVTGGTGLVGANLVRELLAAGDEVVALVRETSDLRGLDGLKVHLRQGDVLDPASVRAAAEGCEVAYHAAAVFSYWGPTAEQLEKVAVDGTRNVLAVAKSVGVRRVVVTSSSVTLGSSTRTVPRDEACEFDDPDAPAYYRSKVEQERAAFELGEALGLEVCAACPAIVLGPHDYRLSPSNAILLRYLEDPLRITFPGGCNVVHARDVAQGHRLIALHGKPGQRYFLGSENLEWALLHRTIAELAGVAAPRMHATRTAALLTAMAQELGAAVTGRAPKTTRAEANTVGRFYWYRHDRAAALGYRPRPAREAIADALAWLVGCSPHVGRDLAAKLRPSPDVLRLREAFLD